MFTQFLQLFRKMVPVSLLGSSALFVWVRIFHLRQLENFIYEIDVMENVPQLTDFEESLNIEFIDTEELTTLAEFSSDEELSTFEKL